MFLGESFDVVEAIRRLAAEVDSVQQVNAGLKARSRSWRASERRGR